MYKLSFHFNNANNYCREFFQLLTIDLLNEKFTMADLISRQIVYQKKFLIFYKTLIFVKDDNKVNKVKYKMNF